MAADRHCEAVYQWEDEWAAWNRQTLSLPKARAYIRTACAYYKLPPPRVRKHSGKAMAYTCGSLISLPPWCMNEAIALHEAAHYITDRTYPRAADHGPTWLGVYLWLLEKAAVAPREALRATMRKHGLKWQQRAPK